MGLGRPNLFPGSSEAGGVIARVAGRALETTAMASSSDPSLDLLFGLLALQNGMIDQAQLVAAFQAWTLEKDRSLADHLISRNALEPEQRAVVESLVALHLKKHGGNAAQSLAAVRVDRLARDGLESLADAEIDASLAHLGSAPHNGAGETPTHGPLFGESQNERPSVLAQLGFQLPLQAATRIFDGDVEADPQLTQDGGPKAGESVAESATAGRYRLLGEIAQGGMGVVFRGRDPDLGRDLALKMLLRKHKNRADLVHRFVEEAQICGQLQHPGVVPIYELGALADNRPFFTMKLVKGRTLAVLLAERGSSRTSPLDQSDPDGEAPDRPHGDLPRFLTIFEAICQTVAYAHSRGVIHRDLKPANVMVGSYGEVQVMDWGLAKVLPRDGEPAREAPRPVQNETIVATARSGSNSDLSVSGSVLGTPAYMAPEQARGDNDLVDRRVDVFALGSILCAILTGEPAFTGASAKEILRKSSAGDLTEARARLEGCGADSELTGLARDCLASNPTDRPTDAGAVAARVTAYLAGVQARLRSTEMARAAESARAKEAQRTAAAAEARAAAERRARRLFVTLAVLVFFIVGAGAAGWRWIELERLGRAREATAKVTAAVQEATQLRGQAQAAAPGDMAPWTLAVASAEKTRDLLTEGVEPGLKQQVENLVALVVAERVQAQSAADAAESDRQLVGHLVDIRSAKVDELSGIGTDAAYASAFRDAGINPDTMTPEQCATAVKSRPPNTAEAITQALDDWAVVRRDLRLDAVGAKRPAAVARLADPDPWRNKLRVPWRSQTNPLARKP
jgi:serine/threonine-protein kinase